MNRIIFLAFILLGSCGGTSSDTPLPKEPIFEPAQPIIENGNNTINTTSDKPSPTTNRSTP